ncbi:MAG: heme-binding domain-containing protein [SAR324 cluster bacterium]|nr:heme-binding domain-containing protein [SAR324 cluster bacterium]
MRIQKIAFALIIGGVIIWGGSLAIAKIILPEKNPPVKHQDPIIGKQSDPILKRSCFDCHSNETRWPWYTYMPVISVLLAHDVDEGRGELNFSEWSQYSLKKKTQKLKESIEKIEEKEMPMKIYTLVHPETIITSGELAFMRKEISESGISIPKERSSKKREDEDHKNENEHD